jgi:hypothetical protein
MLLWPIFLDDSGGDRLPADASDMASGGRGLLITAVFDTEGREILTWAGIVMGCWSPV